MHTLTWALAAASLSSAAMLTELRSTPTINVFWRYRGLEDGSPVGIDIFNHDLSAQLIENEICTTFTPFKTYTVHSGTFEKSPLAITVGEHSNGYYGNITLRGQTYGLNDLSDNHGARCVRQWNEDTADIACVIPVPAGMALQSFPVNETSSCIPGKDIEIEQDESDIVEVHVHSNNERSAAHGKKFHTTKHSEPEDGTWKRGSGLCKEDSAMPPVHCKSNESWRKKARHPHKSEQALVIQTTDKLTCSETSGCSISRAEAKTYSYGVMISGGFKGFISVGGSYNQGGTTTDTKTCNGQAKETICATDHIPYLDYNVNCYDYFYDCGPDHLTYRSGEYEYRIRAPVKGEKHTYCRSSGCHDSGHREFEKRSGPV